MTTSQIDELIVPQLGPPAGDLNRPVGGKAKFLLDICHLVDVPEFVVIPPSWFTVAAEPHLAEIADRWASWDTAHQKYIQSERRLAGVQLTAEMRTALTTELEESLPGVRSFAVRSSAEGEDGQQRSFAGLYDSKLKVTGPGWSLEEAIIAVWRSWFSVRAIVHRAELHQDEGAWQPPAMAVVVQRMINAEVAGVAVAHQDSVETEWVEGTGDRLVDGSVDPAQRLVTTPIQNPTGRIERAAAAALVLREQLGLGDLDVEWAADRARVWIVQARPLTAQVPVNPGLSWVSSSAEPVLRTTALYAETAPGEVLPLGPVAELIAHYRTKRRPLYVIGSEHGCELGAALVVHFNAAGLVGSGWADLIGRLGPQAVLDWSDDERQVIIATGNLRQHLVDHCGDDPDRLRTVVIREFIIGDCGAVSAVSGADVRVEYSLDGLLSLNRGTGSTDEFLISRDGNHGGTHAAAPPGWPAEALTAIDRVTRQLTDRFGNAAAEWVLHAGRLVLVDYSLADGADATLPVGAGRVISCGSCRGPAVVIPSSASDVLAKDSVAPVVSVSTPLPHPADTAVHEVYEAITRLADRPVVVARLPYAVLAALLPYVAGFVFTGPASRLCHLAILMRERGIPAIWVPAEDAPEDGEIVAFDTDDQINGQLRRGRAG